jgi:hypothetical protein
LRDRDFSTPPEDFTAETSFRSPPTILLFNASQTSEKSKSSLCGSLFTRYFIKVLEEISLTTGTTSWDLVALCRAVQEHIEDYREFKNKKVNQTLSVYCSQPLAPVLWWWLHSRQPIAYDPIMDLIYFSGFKISPA